VLVVLLTLATVPSAFVTAVDRFTSPQRAHQDQVLKPAMASFAAIGVLAVLVRASLVAIKVVAGRYVLIVAAAAYVVATVLQGAFRSFDSGMLEWVAGAGIAAGMTFLPQIKPHFQKVPRQPGPATGLGTGRRSPVMRRRSRVRDLSSPVRATDRGMDLRQLTSDERSNRLAFEP
jgi:hypothetical protein